MQVTRVLLLGSLVTVSQSAIEGISRLPDGVVAALPGDLYIGGLFPVHQRDLISGTCADELRTDGLIYYESLRLSLEEINNRSDILPGVKLGAVALDTCSSEKYAVGMVILLHRILLNFNCI